MYLEPILKQLDTEIDRLNRARHVLTDDIIPEGVPKANPRKAKGRGGRNISPEGRKRISEAVSRRWAKQKKQAA